MTTSGAKCTKLNNLIPKHKINTKYCIILLPPTLKSVYDKEELKCDETF
jgi:hypothetical protein